MKKIYINLFAIGFATLLSGGLMAQTDAQLSPSQISQDEKATILSTVQVQTQGTAKSVCPTSDTLTTPLLSGNGHSGNMFDVIVGANDIKVKTFWVSHDLDDQVSIYYKSGTFVGNETNPGAWTYLDSGFVAGNGDGLVGVIPVDIALTLTAGQTYGFYVTDNNNTDFNYTNGTAVGSTWASNADVTILEGNGGAFFDVTFTPRNFNGVIEYCVESAGIEDLNAEDVSIYPNPASTELNIDLSDLQASNSSVAIFNVLGELVAQDNNLSVTSNNILDISNLDAGVYFVTISADGKELTAKVLVD